MASKPIVPFFASIPHAGEEFPPEVLFLKQLSQEVILCDVDRFVDVLYQPAIKKTAIPCVQQPWHRYVVDANRLPEDVDRDSVEGSKNPSGSFTTGFYWVKTTKGEVILSKPHAQELHTTLVQKYFRPFHDMIKKQFDDFRAAGASNVYHVDLHSMPSKGTKAHRDPGETRAEIVISDFEGKSSSKEFCDLVVASYKEAGFEVKLNWPYVGGKITQTYGKPEIGQHTIQVEARRGLYMDETSKELLPVHKEVQNKLTIALTKILSGLASLS